MAYARRYIINYLLLLMLLLPGTAMAKAAEYELSAGWKCRKAAEVAMPGEQLSDHSYSTTGWLPAIVPGTILTTLLANNLLPDPFYGMNNKRIPDIYTTGRDYYTYWFINDFDEKAAAGEQVLITFRGVNYSYDVYVNGHKVSNTRLSGMYLRRRFNITPFLAISGHNRLVVIVYPPDPVGNPNGGQGGDGVIARGLTNQYVAGWDWIQPIADRNTGIWDKVLINKTGAVTLRNTHIVTHVAGIRKPGGTQPAASIAAITELENTDPIHAIKGKVHLLVAGWDKPEREDFFEIALAPGEKRLVNIPAFIIADPRLWWPNGYGRQELYDMTLSFATDTYGVSDEEHISFGIRELTTAWNSQTQSRELYVNGQRIFLKGGNRILSDELLRFSNERYDAEMRMHRDMNLNLVRVWGGGITERPEFYDACDRYGLLVMQDFWVSGDCNGRWYDPYKLADTTIRRQYPDDHNLFLAACADQVKMLRNHPSLAFWCGGNEIRPPADILRPLKDSILPLLDGTRYFFEYSNHDSMSLDAHDGPYTIQANDYFWQHRSWGFNSEIGSVGIGDRESLERFIPPQNMNPPSYDTLTKKWAVDSVWAYHKYSGYDSAIEKYGHAADIEDFAQKAQLVNYDQYRSLTESFTAKMWSWYTGVIIWKTQNPWTAMVGQMYDVYLDPNACMYGLAEGAKPVHAFYDPVKHTVAVANSTAGNIDSVWLEIKGLDKEGKEKMAYAHTLLPDSLNTHIPYICHEVV